MDFRLSITEFTVASEDRLSFRVFSSNSTFVGPAVVGISCANDRFKRFAGIRCSYRGVSLSFASMLLGKTPMNRPQTVTEILSKLTELGVKAALSGGWAEEAFGLSRPRAHKDIDLVIEADDFSAIDRFLAGGVLENEIAAKRFFHKRAFLFAETMVEIYLVQRRANRLVTLFWGDNEYRWLDPLVATTRLNGIMVRAVTPQNLIEFRRSHKSHQPWRWSDPASLAPLASADFRQLSADVSGPPASAPKAQTAIQQTAIKSEF